MAPTIGVVLRQAREVRQLSAGDAARAASISPAYLSRLENDAVKKPSPHVLHQLSEALAVPYAELLSLSGYRLPEEPDRDVSQSIGAALRRSLGRRAGGAARVPRLVSRAKAIEAESQRAELTWRNGPSTRAAVAVRVECCRGSRNATGRSRRSRPGGPGRARRGRRRPGCRSPGRPSWDRHG